MKRILAVLLLLCLPLNALAGIKIARANRIANQAPGFCLWCSLEMLGRHHGVTQVEGLAQYYKDWRYEEWDEEKQEWVKKPWPKGHSFSDGASQLKTLKVKHHGYFGVGRAQVKKACDDGLGCAISLRWWKPIASGAPGFHAVVVTDVTDTKVLFVDPNDPYEVYSVDHDWFDYYFTGTMMTIEAGE